LSGATHNKSSLVGFVPPVNMGVPRPKMSGFNRDKEFVEKMFLEHETVSHSASQNGNIFVVLEKFFKINPKLGSRK